MVHLFLLVKFASQEENSISIREERRAGGTFYPSNDT